MEGVKYAESRLWFNSEIAKLSEDARRIRVYIDCLVCLDNIMDHVRGKTKSLVSSHE